MVSVTITALVCVTVIGLVNKGITTYEESTRVDAWTMIQIAKIERGLYDDDPDQDGMPHPPRNDKEDGQ